MADVVPIALVVLSAVMFWTAPVLSRPGLYFGTTVASGFQHTKDAQRLLRHYRAGIAASSIVLLVLLILVPGRATAPLWLAAQSVIATSLWLITRRSVRANAAPTLDVRTASLTLRAERIPGGPAALAGPFLIVALAALVVAANWDLIPERLPSLGRGSTDTVAKSATSVFKPFVFVGALLVAFTLQTIFLVRRTRQIASFGPSFEAEARFKRRSAAQSLLASYVMAAGPSWFAVNRALGRPSTDSGLAVAETLWIGAILALSVGVTLWMMRVGQGGQRSVPISTTSVGDRTADDTWIGGLVYFNPSDPAVFVERRLGVGWTLNAGNVWAWLLLTCGIGLPLAVLWLMR